MSRDKDSSLVEEEVWDHFDRPFRGQEEQRKERKEQRKRKRESTVWRKRKRKKRGRK